MIYWSSKYFTENVFFNDPLIAYGPCPACSSENRVFFGDILGVEVRSDWPSPPLPPRDPENDRSRRVGRCIACSCRAPRSVPK